LWYSSPIPESVVWGCDRGIRTGCVLRAVTYPQGGEALPWEEELKKSITTIPKLKKYVELSPREEKQLRRITERHPMQITRYYMSLINPHDPDDPIRKMAIPHVDELDLTGSYDPSGEMENTKLPGLQHKYPRTALVLVTNRCAVYCRHCFRKRLVGLPSKEILRRFADAAAYIEEHKEISNVLLSGGDPLILRTKTIEKILERLASIAHLNFVRIGTRVPVTFPMRIIDDTELVRVLRHYSRPNRRLFVTTQFNHEREITDRAAQAISLLLRSGVPVNNQTVLLRGVNDDPAALAKVQSNLVRIGINPYYVFQCRPVKRVRRHFTVPIARSYEIVERAKATLDGYSKRFKFVMSHRTGKMEIVGIMGDRVLFKYHEAKDRKNDGRIIQRTLTEEAAWLDELLP
jgi:lysine 2,3-aminomutase